MANNTDTHGHLSLHELVQNFADDPDNNLSSEAVQCLNRMAAAIPVDYPTEYGYGYIYGEVFKESELMGHLVGYLGDCEGFEPAIEDVMTGVVTQIVLRFESGGMDIYRDRVVFWPEEKNEK